MTIPPGRQLVEGLDPDLPLALFPVRLATRFHRGDGPTEPPTELRVRIFPDLVGADGHLPELTPLEVAQGRTYWKRLVEAGDDPAGRDEVNRWLVGQLGAPRAAWVAGVTRREAGGDKAESEAAAASAGDRLRPTLARLLPDRWRVALRAGFGEFVVRDWSRPVRRPLPVAPNLADIPEDGDIRDLLDAQGMEWMVDYDEAVRVGMAVTLSLAGIPPTEPIERLVVYGVRHDDDPSAEDLAAVLEAHRFTDGLEFVAQGTPTNNTETVEAGFTETPDDLDAFFDRQLANPAGSRPPLGRRRARLGTATAADATALAFGLEGPQAVDHCQLATDQAGERASAMNRALFPGTIAYLLADMLATNGAPAITGDDLRWLRNWFRDWVRGGGFLPTMRIGNQPYGILPVTRLTTQWFDEPSDRISAISYAVQRHDSWPNSLGAVPSFSADIDRTPEEEAAALASVLGAVPHPTAFRLREAENAFDRLADEWDDELAQMEDTIQNDTIDTYWTHDYRDNGVAGNRQERTTEGSIDDQATALSGMRDIGENYLSQDLYRDAWDGFQAVVDQINDVMLARTTAHKSRAETRAFQSNFSEANLPTRSDPPLWYVEYGDDGAAEDGSYPTLRVVPGGTRAQLESVLRQLAAGYQAAGQGNRPPYRPRRARAMLHKLVEHGIAQVAPDQAAEAAAGVSRLADMVASGEVTDPTGELERLTRETLGLVGHRQDAWLSSLAADRLARLRASTPTGLQVGGYGWLVDLVPDEAGPDTKGFIHAPSLDHAATAAVLRSAWLAFANHSTDAPFSIDLSSDRVRRAKWILEGVRNGIDLAELLGSRFERRLHDTGQSALIDDIRELVLTAAGRNGAPDNAIVDGLALAVATSPSTERNPLRQALLDLRRTQPGFPDDGLGRVLRDTVADIDAVADLLLAQSVHSVIKGNLAEAAAALSVAGAGQAGIPEPRVVDVNRGSQLVTTRVVAVFDGKKPATDTLLTLAEPALGGWLESVISRLGPLVVSVRFGGEVRTLRLTDLGLGAAEVVGLCPTGGDADASPLAALIEAAARRRWHIEPDVPVLVSGVGEAGDGAPTLGELVVSAGSLRAAVGRARPLHADDLTVGEGQGPAVELGDLLARLDAVVARLDTLARRSDLESSVLVDLADWVSIDAAATMAALAAGADDRAELLARLPERASDRMAELLAPWPEGYDGLDDAGKAAVVAERMRTSLPLSIAIVPRCTVPDRAELEKSLASSDRRLGSPTAVAAWLQRVGRVHPSAGAIGEAMTLIEAVAGRPVASHSLAQLPDVDGEGWASIRSPADRTARTCVLSITPMGDGLRGQSVAGVVFDAWTEPIPDTGASTGVAFHFDKPGAKPPQTVLLAAGPTEGGWTVDELHTIVDQTLDLATTRAVGPETLRAWGHTLPASYLWGRVAVTTVDDEESDESAGPDDPARADDGGGAR